MGNITEIREREEEAKRNEILERKRQLKQCQESSDSDLDDFRIPGRDEVQAEKNRIKSCTAAVSQNVKGKGKGKSTMPKKTVKTEVASFTSASRKSVPAVVENRTVIKPRPKILKTPFSVKKPCLGASASGRCCCPFTCDNPGLNVEREDNIKRETERLQKKKRATVHFDSSLCRWYSQPPEKVLKSGESTPPRQQDGDVDDDVLMQIDGQVSLYDSSESSNSSENDPDEGDEGDADTSTTVPLSSSSSESNYQIPWTSEEEDNTEQEPPVDMTLQMLDDQIYRLLPIAPGWPTLQQAELSAEESEPGENVAYTGRLPLMRPSVGMFENKKQDYDNGSSSSVSNSSIDMEEEVISIIVVTVTDARH